MGGGVRRKFRCRLRVHCGALGRPDTRAVAADFAFAAVVDARTDHGAVAHSSFADTALADAALTDAAIPSFAHTAAPAGVGRTDPCADTRAACRVASGVGARGG